MKDPLGVSPSKGNQGTTRLAKKWRATYSSIQSARPSTSTDQRLSKLDTRFSRFSRHFLASFLKGVKYVVYPGACIDLLVLFSLFLNSTLGDKIQLTFSSSLCTISSSFWWHTSGENIDAHGGAKRQVSHCCLPVCLICRSELSLISRVKFSCKFA